MVYSEETDQENLDSVLILLYAIVYQHILSEETLIRIISEFLMDKSYQAKIKTISRNIHRNKGILKLTFYLFLQKVFTPAT